MDLEVNELVTTLSGVVTAALANGWTGVGAVAVLIGTLAAAALFVVRRMNKSTDKRDQKAAEKGAGDAAAAVKAQSKANKSALDRLEG